MAQSPARTAKSQQYQKPRPWEDLLVTRDGQDCQATRVDQRNGVKNGRGVWPLGAFWMNETSRAGAAAPLKVMERVEIPKV